MSNLGILGDAIVLGVTVGVLNKATEPLREKGEHKQKEIKLHEKRISLFD